MSNRLRLILSSGGLVTFFLCVRSASRCLMYSCVRLRVAMLAARVPSLTSGVQVQRTLVDPDMRCTHYRVDHNTPQHKERSYLRTPALTSRTDHGAGCTHENTHLKP